MTDHSTLLFVSPKRGGIMQSSGFLDLKSLMALNRTCKANAFDELSLIMLIENEITRHHGVKTMEEATVFWREICHNYVLLKRWLNRDCGRSRTAGWIKVTKFMLTDALPYEVMLSKMLRTTPTQSERLQQVSERDPFERTLLHRAALAGNAESIKTLLALCTESEGLKTTSMQDRNGWTALHCAAYSDNPELMKLILANYPESERLQAVSVTDNSGWTLLHCAVWSGNRESIETILALYPERLQGLDMPDRNGDTVLHWVTRANKVESTKVVFSLYPESERLQVLNKQNDKKKTPLELMSEKTHKAIMEWLSE